MEAAKLESGAKVENATRVASIRAWTLTAPDYVGKTIADLEAKAAISNLIYIFVGLVLMAMIKAKDGNRETTALVI